MSTRLNILLDMLSFDGTGVNQIIQYPSSPYEKISTRQFNLAITQNQTIPFSVNPNSSFTVFDASFATNISNTATFSITSSGSSYQIFQTGGADANFRTPRAIGLGSDSTFNVTINNSSLVTYQCSVGTSFTTTSVISGDVLYIDSGSPFAAGNKGSFPIISSTTNSVSVVNSNAVAQSSVTLGASYASQFKIFSAAGVPVGSTLRISGGFSPSSYGDYTVQGITDNSVSFNSSTPLAIESNIVPDSTGLTFFNGAPFYLEGSGNLAATLLFDGETQGSKVEPIVQVISSTYVDLS